jgi:GTPase SAR1 family protein
MKFQNVDLEKSTLVHGLPGCGKTWFLLQLLDELTAQGQEVYFCDTKEIESFCETDEKRRERYLNKTESTELIHRLFDEIDARCERLDCGEEVAPVYVLIDELFEFLEDALVKNHLMSLLMIAFRVKVHIIAGVQPLNSAMLQRFHQRIVFKTTPPNSLLLLGDESATSLKVGEYIVGELKK